MSSHTGLVACFKVPNMSVKEDKTDVLVLYTDVLVLHTDVWVLHTDV